MSTPTAPPAFRVAAIIVGTWPRTAIVLAALSAAVACLCVVLMSVHGVQSTQGYAAVSPPARTHNARPWRQLRITATAYDDHAQRTASGTIPHPGTLAVSRDLLRFLPFGSRVEIRGWRYVVEDTMAPHWRRRVDIWVPSRAAALRWGRQRIVLGIPGMRSGGDPDR